VQQARLRSLWGKFVSIDFTYQAGSSLAGSTPTAVPASSRSKRASYRCSVATAVPDSVAKKKNVHARLHDEAMARYQVDGIAINMPEGMPIQFSSVQLWSDLQGAMTCSFWLHADGLPQKPEDPKRRRLPLGALQGARVGTEAEMQQLIADEMALVTQDVWHARERVKRNLLKDAPDRSAVVLELQRIQSRAPPKYSWQITADSPAEFLSKVEQEEGDLILMLL
jgi:hypothetical protein